MGEIGISRREYLYELTFRELMLISQGYERRHRHLWSSVRWQTYNMMATQVGGDKLREHGICKPTDLIRFPWDGIDPPPITDEEIADLQQAMQEWNESHGT